MSLQKIEIFSHLDASGQPQPERFILKGVAYQVEDTGRRWDDKTGQHMLVMANGNQVYELIYKPDSQAWYLKSRPAPRFA